MIATITSATITTITTITSTTSSVTSSAVTGITGALALVAVIAFLAMLIQREMVSFTSNARARAFARGLNIGLVPLGLAFVMIVGNELFRVLG